MLSVDRSILETARTVLISQLAQLNGALNGAPINAVGRPARGGGGAKSRSHTRKPAGLANAAGAGGGTGGGGGEAIAGTAGPTATTRTPAQLAAMRRNAKKARAAAKQRKLAAAATVQPKTMTA